MKRAIVFLVLLAACFTAGMFRLVSAAAEETRSVLILLDDVPETNLPYSTSGEYDRDIAVPILSGAKGFLYKKTTQVNTWLFPVSYANGTPTLILHLEGVTDVSSVSINEIPLTDEPLSIPFQETAELRVMSKGRRGLIRLIFTTLPVIQLCPDGDLFLQRSTDCTVTVADPEYREHGFEASVMTFEGSMSKRGRSSARFNAKHPYNFTLMKDGKKYDKSLLGLRSDSDWLVDSAYNDRSRMRNRVLMDVWHDTYRLPWNQTLSGATKGVYVELFINDTYKGIYALGEKQDRQQLGLAKTGGKWNSLFLRTGATGNKGSSPAGFVSLGSERPEEGDALRWYNVLLKYPTDTALANKELWQDFYDYVRLVVRGTNEEFAENITKYADLDNLARFWLFINAMDLSDNLRKNMAFARLDDRDERFNKFIIVPWDMDSSLGRYYSSRKSRKDELFTNRLFTRLLTENPGNFRQIVYDDWQELREGAFALDTVMSHFDAYYAKISEAGADKREIEKYPDFKSYLKAGYTFKLNFTSEFKYIREFTEERLQWMDKAVNRIISGDVGWIK